MRLKPFLIKLTIILGIIIILCLLASIFFIFYPNPFFTKLETFPSPDKKQILEVWYDDAESNYFYQYNLVSNSFFQNKKIIGACYLDYPSKRHDAYNYYPTKWKNKHEIIFEIKKNQKHYKNIIVNINYPAIPCNRPPDFAIHQ